MAVAAPPLRVDVEPAKQLIDPVAKAVGVGTVLLVATFTTVVVLQPLAGLVTVKV